MSFLGKYKGGVFVLPRKKKEIIVFFMMLAVILFGTYLVVHFFNNPMLVLGMPSIMFYSILTSVSVIVVLAIADRWGVH